jgi:hypothetical protein
MPARHDATGFFVGCRPDPAKLFYRALFRSVHPSPGNQSGPPLTWCDVAAHRAQVVAGWGVSVVVCRV